MQTIRSVHSFSLKRKIFMILTSFFVIFSSIPSVAKEPVILEMWSHWGEEAMKTKFIEETIQSFEQPHSTITIKLRWLPKNRIYQSLQGFLPKDAGPDRGVASNMLFQGLLLRFAGVNALEGLKSGVTSWDDPDIVAAIEYMKQLIDAGVFPKNMNLLKYHEGRSLFIEGAAAMSVEGTWFYGKIADENGNLPPTLQGKLGAMDYPIVPDGKGNYAIERMTGGSYVIRNSSLHTERAVQFLNFMTSEENGRKWIQYTQSPFGVDIDFKEHVSYPFLQELFASRQEISELLVPGIGALLTPEEFKVWTRDLGISFMGGNMSVEELIHRLRQAARKNL